MVFFGCLKYSFAQVPISKLEDHYMGATQSYGWRSKWSLVYGVASQGVQECIFICWCMYCSIYFFILEILSRNYYPRRLGWYFCMILLKKRFLTCKFQQHQLSIFLGLWVEHPFEVPVRIAFCFFFSKTLFRTDRARSVVREELIIQALVSLVGPDNLLVVIFQFSPCFGHESISGLLWRINGQTWISETSEYFSKGASHHWFAYYDCIWLVH